MAEEASPRTHDIQIDDCYTVRTLSQCAGSPDGRRILYALGQWDLTEKKLQSTLWVIDQASGESTQRTTAGDGFQSPRWDAHSRFIYALHKPAAEDNDDQTTPKSVRQIWRIAADDGEPQPVTASEQEIERFDICETSATGTRLYYTTEQESDGVITSSLQGFDMATATSFTVREVSGAIKELAASPDGRYVALVTAPDKTLLKNEGWSQVIVEDVETQECVLIT